MHNGTVDIYIGPTPKTPITQLLQTTNPVIARPLSGSPNCVCMVMSYACFGSRHSPYLVGKTCNVFDMTTKRSLDALCVRIDILLL